MPTLANILDAVIYGRYAWTLNGAKNLGYVGTATAGAAGSLTDSQLVDTGADATTWVGYYLQRPTAAAAADLYRRVTAFTNTTGLLAHGGANYTNNPVATDAYRLTYIDPRVLMNAINDGLYDCVVPYMGLISLVADPDMENSGVTDWTNTNSTLTKQTGAANVFSGVQSLRAVNSALNGQAAAAAFNAYPNTEYIVSAIVRGANFTPVLLALDAASATIDSVTGSAFTNDWQVLWMTVTTPNSAAGRSIQIVLRGSEANATLEWDCVFVLPSGANRLAMPSWLEHQSDIQNIIEADYRGSGITGVSDTYRADAYDQLSWPEFQVIPEMMRQSLTTVGRSLQVSINPTYNGVGILYAVGMRRGTTLGTTETNTTHVPLELAVAAAYRRYAEGRPEYRMAVDRFRAAERLYIPRMPTVVQHRMRGV